jgi:hypothetical protein
MIIDDYLSRKWSPIIIFLTLIRYRFQILLHKNLNKQRYKIILIWFMQLPQNNYMKFRAYIAQE